jgi:aryl-alcohol dehydrogenase-like predicted oxidoreductase
VLGLGGSTLGGGLYFRDESEMLRIIDAACDAGVNFFDTSNTYGRGSSEKIIGKALSRRRDEVVIATKGGMQMSRLGGLAMDLRPLLLPLRPLLRPFRRKLNVMRDHQKLHMHTPVAMRRHLEGSLRRLGTDYLDLYQFYNITESALQRDDFFDVMMRFKEEGKIRACGLTVVFPDPIFQALRFEELETVQFAVNLLDREAARRFLPLARERGIGVIARSPLAQGFLTAADGHVMGYETSHRSMESLKSLAAQGKKLRVLAGDRRTMAQTALRYCLQLDGISTTIFSVTSLDELEENLGALESPELTDEELRQVEELAPTPPASPGLGSGTE